MRIVVTTQHDGSNVWRGFREALSHVAAEPGLRAAIGTHASFAFLGVPIIQLIPTFALDVLGVGPEAYGLLLGSLGIGAVAAGLGGGFADGVVAPSRMLATGLGLAAVSLLLLGTASALPTGIFAMILFGAAYVTIVAIDHSAIQRLCEDRLRGRVTALWLMSFGACMPGGTLLQSAATDRIGARPVLLVDAGLLAVVLAAGLLLRVLPRIDGRREDTGRAVPNH
jgi:hypothetical protein